MQGGRHGSLGAFVAHTELVKNESTKMMAEQEGQITKLNEARCEMKDAMTEMAKANANMMAAIGATGKQVTELTGRVDDISVKTDRNGKDGSNRCGARKGWHSIPARRAGAYDFARGCACANG